MENLRVIAVVLFMATPVLLAIALAVRFAGRGRPLNIVDYRKVGDAASLHRWAGHRLALLPVASAVSGYAIFQNPSLGLPLLTLFVAVVLGVGGWIAVGASRFEDRR